MTQSAAPLLSVIIPLYNKQETIERAVRSVLAQSYPHFELLVVDDGSTDQSFMRCLAFSDLRLQVIQQSNQGVSAARNRGAAMASGHYLCFLDADDAYEPDFLHNIGRLIEQEPQGALFSCAFRVIDETGLNLPFRSTFSADFASVVPDFFHAYQHNRYFICASSFAIRKTVFIQIGGFPHQATIGEDIFLWCQAALKGVMLHCAKPSATVYQNAANRTIHQQQQPLAFHSQYFLQDMRWQQGLSAMQIQQVNRFIKANTLLAALGALRFGRVAVARGYARLLARRYPLRAMLLWLLSFLPTSLFGWLRQWRNRG